MKKHVSRILVIIMSLIMSLGIFSGCGGDKDYDSDGNLVTDKSKILDISLWNSGAGTKFLENLVERFKINNKGIAVNIVASGSLDTMYTTLPTDESANEFDLYFSYGPKWRKYFEGEYASKNIIEPLTDVLEYTPVGEDKKIKDKFPASMLEDYKYKGDVYALPWQTMATGITYHSDMFTKNGWEVPLTSNQLTNLALEISESGKTPFIHVPGYWSYAQEVWWAQYEGIESYNDFYQLKHNGVFPSEDVYDQVGLRKSLEALYDIVAPEGYTMLGSNTTDFTILQTKYINGDAAMYSTGGWLEVEMSKKGAVKKQEVKMMKTPVLSSIVEKLDLNTNSAIKDKDKALQQIIKYIDDGEQGAKPNATDADILRVKDVRNLVVTVGAQMPAVIPAYSPSKRLAKDFLKFMMSDEGTKIYADTLAMLPPWNFSKTTETDKSTWSPFAKSCFEIQQSARYIFNPFSHPIYYNSSYTDLFYERPERNFTALGNDKETVNTFLSREKGEFAKNWEGYLTSAGIK